MEIVGGEVLAVDNKDLSASYIWDRVFASDPFDYRSEINEIKNLEKTALSNGFLRDFPRGTDLQPQLL
ncbi:hypothetical protein A3D84_00350 [Candidatus Woesebacteria bacterium RIFCSPHIGHO2_02_FULL_42_20]|uniref:Uncharacterized protein n=1 Tax=Candidatus Woesebacteria bacterium RIFCSPHIGHO2_12_FULL_41_24 TaxID=1802510 RepID=A0A1F8ATQ3_9BACT|nr:MAG: hypothetical protein A2W15_01850 [Candidatus Woesebacteria bacterium RBG_16_41_13]OGM29702.1 MAG: hypothetical protein A2873_02270 [Candidatus Woesebacteria bacterium RIFCSPHIGHO2_01_FULL_42_80]OGM35230.1 MAG: hypothetical protein A3D84_00350 [Candidatus Woesebacteria bacterium RIFCSPHIGHO2_02_FULL_42_20]OGM55124.1 MAG: hypothetical protein A3E44_04355 [Candidatus Woesebacteria bacterium RIFCSPHIGHO2_12_FULL_41_24]OGM67696.1 MAG: hypothetical protein A2969_02060 [Candidatus Woesebacteri